MNASYDDYVAALKALRCAVGIDLSGSERDACNVVVADYSCGGTASFKPTQREIKTVRNAVARI